MNRLNSLPTFGMELFLQRDCDSCIIIAWRRFQVWPHRDVNIYLGPFWAFAPLLLAFSFFSAFWHCRHPNQPPQQSHLLTANATFIHLQGLMHKPLTRTISCTLMTFIASNCPTLIADKYVTLFQSASNQLTKMIVWISARMHRFHRGKLQKYVRRPDWRGGMEELVVSLFPVVCTKPSSEYR